MSSAKTPASADSPNPLFLTTRRAELDPKHMFATLYADFLLRDGSPAALPHRFYLVDALCEEWAKSDPAAAIQALTDVSKFSGLGGMRISVFDQLMNTNVEAGVAAMQSVPLDPKQHAKVEAGMK